MAFKCEKGSKGSKSTNLQAPSIPLAFKIHALIALHHLLTPEHSSSSRTFSVRFSSLKRGSIRTGTAWPGLRQALEAILRPPLPPSWDSRPPPPASGSHLRTSGRGALAAASTLASASSTVATSHIQVPGPCFSCSRCSITACFSRYSDRKSLPSCARPGKALRRSS